MICDLRLITVHCLYFHFYSFICLSFHFFPYPTPSVTAERSCSLFFGEPDDRRLAYDVVFGDETEKAGVRKIDGIVGTYPVVVFGKIAVLHGLAFHIKGVVLDFGLFLFVKYQGIPQQSLVPRIYAYGFAFCQRGLSEVSTSPWSSLTIGSIQQFPFMACSSK